MALIDKLNAIGDAIRAKTGKSEKLSLDDMVTEIGGISGGGGSIIVGGNLFNAEETVIDMYITPSGAETSYRGWSISSYIPMEQGKLYSVAPLKILVAASNLQYCSWYDENKGWIRKLQEGDFVMDKIGGLTPIAGAAYIRFSHVTANINALEVYEINTENI